MDVTQEMEECLNKSVAAFNDFLGEGKDAEQTVMTLVGIVEGCLRSMLPDRNLENSEKFLSSMVDLIVEEISE